MGSCPESGHKNSGSCLRNSSPESTSNLRRDDTKSSENVRAPGLSKERVVSSIPIHDEAGKDNGNWVYPSEQMFFDAMRRKNWNPSKEVIPIIVPIHNAINEECWRRILEWESLHKR